MEKRFGMFSDALALKAELNDTGTAPRFVVDDDNEYIGGEGIAVATLTGEDALVAWEGAIANLRGIRQGILGDSLLRNVPDLEIKKGAAAEKGDNPSEVSVDPWRYTKNR